jgi:hypothetical protein
VTTNNEQDIYGWWHKIQKTTKRGGDDFEFDSSEVDGPSASFVIPIVINERGKRISFYLFYHNFRRHCLLFHRQIAENQNIQCGSSHKNIIRSLLVIDIVGALNLATGKVYHDSRWSCGHYRTIFLNLLLQRQDQQPKRIALYPSGIDG